MRFLKPLLSLKRWDKQRNVDVRSILNQDNIADEIRNYQQNWLQHVKRMGKNCLPKITLLYQPHGKGDICLLRRKWREQDYLKAIELTLRRRIKSHLLFAGIIRSSPFSLR